MAHRPTRSPGTGRPRPAERFLVRVASPDARPPDRPHIRLGLAWVVITGIAAAAGPGALAMVFAPVAALAAAQGARTWRRQERRAAVPVSAGGAALVAAASAFGVVAVGVAVLVVAILLTVVAILLTTASLSGGPSSRRASPVLTGVIAIACGLAGASPVLLRDTGFIPVFVLLSFVHVYDASAYVVAAGATSDWEGRAAGVASIAAVTLAVAAVLSPPFRGLTPWLFGFLAAALAPLGPVAADRFVGDRRARIPALRRLDSLLVVGPVWAIAAAVTLR